MGLNIDKALSSMILSPSGWRGIFADDIAGEESSSPNISNEHEIIIAYSAKVFSGFLRQKLKKTGPIIVGRDTRPTSLTIMDAVLRSLIACGEDPICPGIVAAPEIMAWVRSIRAAGIIYISASHNPIGHNGLKFGLSDGSVLSPDQANELISLFKAFIDESTPELEKETLSLLRAGVSGKLENVYSKEPEYKAEALDAYNRFSKEVIINSAFEEIKKGIKERPLGIAADFNGSARTVSIDRDFISEAGIKFSAINSKPGEIMHCILPEGKSLEPCRDLLQDLYSKDPAFILGYVNDCDGDRGNLVYIDENDGRAKILRAQEVFALACLAELSGLAAQGIIEFDDRGRPIIPSKTAIAVNDPTSLRIDRIATHFGIRVFRAEVGEANVVELARKLREKDYTVRFLGEGSAGGIIIHPSMVRDPINTIFSILKLLTIRSYEGGKGLFEIWCDLCKIPYRADFTLADIIASLPGFTSTESYAEKAVLKIKTADHGILKERYEKIFLRDWEEKKGSLLAEYGITGWEAKVYNGSEERRFITNFSESGSGGLKIEFLGGKEAFIWMRGSRTEPVFRIMADAEGPGDLEDILLNWQHEMVIEADNY
ncbi:MAG: phosphatidylglycerol lysyltransferase [Treponema sp.]|nr:phosphatidylglycerol lysyltransferase [Treponema sp.]